MTDRAARRARSDARAREQAELLGFGRLHLFVPALMSVGLLFWIVSEITEIARAHADEARVRRAGRMAASVTDEVLGRHRRALPGLRPRAVYLVAAVVLLGGSAYVVIGSAANYLRAGGYVHDISWLLAVAVAVGLVAMVFGIVALLTFVAWPTPPAWVAGVVLRTPLASPLDGEEVGHRPPWYLTAAVALNAAALAAVAALVAWSPVRVEQFNVEVTAWFVEHEPLAALGLLDSYGLAPWIGGAALLLIVVAGLRCRVLLVAGLGAVATSVLIGLALRPLVAQAALRERTVEVAPRSFPSVGAALTVVLLGCLVLALASLFQRAWIAWPLRFAGAVLVAASAVHHLADGEIPTDVLGGLLLGLLLLLVVHWSLAQGRWHRSCVGCHWSAAGAVQGPLLGAVPIHPSRHDLLRAAARVTAAAATIGLAVLTLSVDLPEGTVGYSLGPGLHRTVQLVLTLLMSAGVLLAWRWEGVGAAVMALAAAGAGIFAALEYQAGIAVVLTVVLMVPAVLTWLSWQHTRSPLRIIGLAVVTTLLIGTTWVSAATVHDRYFGPTHPASVAPDIPVDRVEWLWAGGLTSSSLTVTARLVAGADLASLEVEPVAGGRVTDSEADVPDEDRMVQLAVKGLDPGVGYRYRIVVDGRADEGRGFGSFTTPVDGPMSFTVTAGACAMTGSNGAVYDAIAAEDPILNLVLGDLHYSNITSTDPTAFIDAYGWALTTPAQSALARQVPFAYVWDDHDYGPNDADASSPSRSAVRDAYRRAAPHYEVPSGDAPIHQAFTIGRVRFVITDARSERTADSLLGDEQLAWLLDELRTASRTHAAVVWVNSVPWIGEAAEGADGWAGYADERALVADAIAAGGIDNLVMVSGDAHMVAIDDGTNTDYSTTGGAGFPLLHAAALDRPGNVKGGPYSEGAFPGGGQYGVLDIVDDGGPTVTLTLSGRTWDGRTLVSWTTELGGAP